MSAVDRLLQRWRIRMAEPFIRTGDRLLDIGCFDGALIQRVLPRISCAAGIDPRATPSENAKVTIFRGVFPAMSPWQPASFDCVVMLATLEHVADPGDVGRRCFELLAPGGRLVVTVPHEVVDHIVNALIRIGVADGMDFEAHHGFALRETAPMMLGAGFTVFARRRFELGLNSLFVFEKPSHQK